METQPAPLWQVGIRLVEKTLGISEETFLDLPANADLHADPLRSGVAPTCRHREQMPLNNRAIPHDADKPEMQSTTSNTDDLNGNTGRDNRTETGEENERPMK